MKHLQLQPLDRRKVCRIHCKSIPSEVDVYVLSLTYLYTCTPVHLYTWIPVHLYTYLYIKIVTNDKFPNVTKTTHSMDWLMMPTSMMKKAHTLMSAVIYVETRIHTYPLHSWADHFPTRRFWIDKGWYKIVVTNGPKNSHRGK